MTTLFQVRREAGATIRRPERRFTEVVFINEFEDVAARRCRASTAT